SFLLAALLWKPVYRQWNAIVAKRGPPAPALVRAADEALERQSGKLGIQKRYVADMHDIRLMQPRFERANTRSIWRMLEQPRFRAAVDLLQRRAEAHEGDSVFAQWWMDLGSAGVPERARLIEEREAENRAKPSSGARRRRTRRRGPRKAAAAGAQTDTGGAGAD